MNTDQRPDEELNRVIAEWCGWTNVWGRFGDFIRYAGTESEQLVQGLEIPNYCRDLNACHEAEMRLFLQGEGEAGDPYVRRRYLHALDAITGDQWNTVSATARQRAEALVRVIESSKQL